MLSKTHHGRGAIYNPVLTVLTVLTYFALMAVNEGTRDYKWLPYRKNGDLFMCN